MNAHQFALYLPLLKGSEQEIIISDPELVRRIARVLRLQISDKITLFNRTDHAHGTLSSIDKKTVTIQIDELKPNIIFTPPISFLLPLLKRDTFEQAVYFLVEAGVQHIYPVITQKTQRRWGGNKELDRLARIIIAAAEQSKNYAFPQMQDPIKFEDALATHSSGCNIFFDPAGQPIQKTIAETQKAKKITLLIGPEGDLTDEEKGLVKGQNFVFSRLTPTILRAQQAAGVAACLIRSAHY